MAYNKFKKLAQLDTLLGVKDVMQAWLPASFSATKVSNNLLENLLEAKNDNVNR